MGASPSTDVTTSPPRCITTEVKIAQLILDKATTAREHKKFSIILSWTECGSPEVHENDDVNRSPPWYIKDTSSLGRVIQALRRDDVVVNYFILAKDAYSLCGADGCDHRRQPAMCVLTATPWLSQLQLTDLLPEFWDRVMHNARLFIQENKTTDTTIESSGRKDSVIQTEVSVYPMIESDADARTDHALEVETVPLVKG